MLWPEGVKHPMQNGEARITNEIRMANGRTGTWGFIRAEESWNAEVVYAINQALEAARRPASASKLLDEVTRELQKA